MMILSKNSVIQLLATSSIWCLSSSSMVAGSGIRGSSPFDERELGPGAPKVTKTEWKECVGMDLSECAIMVRRDVRRHEIPDLVVKTIAPRTKEEIQQTYMKVGIAVNVDGIVTGDKNDGMITYPYVWVSATPGKTRNLGPYDCSGMTSWECCQQIREDVPDVDIHNNHIQCFAHLNELVPDVRTDRPVYENENLAYFTFVYDQTNNKYREQIFSPQQIAAIAAREQAALEAQAATIQNVLEQDTATVGELLSLEADLMSSTAPYGDVQNMLGDIENEIEANTDNVAIGSLGDPSGSDDPILDRPIRTDPESRMAAILTAVHHLIHDYSVTDIITEKHVWIYGSHTGKVWRPPQVGGVFDGHEEYVKDLPGFENHTFGTRYVSDITKAESSASTGGARYLQWVEVDV